ncbi:MAG: Phenylacetic acid catabolic protein [Planctomycetaceae bacterium]
MTKTKTVRSRAEMSPEYFQALSRMILSQAYRELAASVGFAHALQFVPGLEFKQKVIAHVVEEMGHYKTCAELYREIGAGDLDAVCQGRVERERRIPPIESFLELGVAQFLYDRASGYQLREYENSSFDPYCRVVGQILEEEEGHEDFGAEVLIEHCRDPRHRPAAQELFDKWLAVSLRSFGRPGTPGDRFAVSVGLKTRGSAAVMQDYVDDVKSTMRVCGLQFPTRQRLRELGVETAPDIDLTL